MTRITEISKMAARRSLQSITCTTTLDLEESKPIVYCFVAVGPNFRAVVVGTELIFHVSCAVLRTLHLEEGKSNVYCFATFGLDFRAILFATESALYAFCTL